MNPEKIKKRNLTFFNFWAKTYDYGPLHFWMEKFRQAALPWITLSPGKKLVDLSCGTGSLLLSIHQKSLGKMKLWGLEFSPEMLKKARKKLPKEVQLVQGDVHQLKFPENYFDYVLSTEAFHHYYDQKKALAEMVRAAKNGGKVIIVDVEFFFSFIHRIFERIEPGCVRVNIRKEMIELFRAASLKKIQQKRSFLFAVATKGVK